MNISIERKLYRWTKGRLAVILDKHNSNVIIKS